MSDAEPPLPRTIGARLARLLLRIFGGWKMEGVPPTDSRAVVLAVPHTHNLDGLLLVLLVRSIGYDVNWMVKDIWVKPPIGWVTRRLGAVPVDRRVGNSMVEQMIERFDREDDFVLLIPPEGTRSRTEHWKSGFHRIAEGADVPVIPSYLDYERRRAGFGPAIELTGDKAVDMDELRAFYTDAASMARHPEQFGPIRLEDES